MERRAMELEILSADPVGTPRPHPLLFVHGAWHGAWCWAEHFLPYFARHGYACHALSLRGHGASPARRLRWLSIADYVSDVGAVAASLGVPPVVVGHSMGGLVVQRYLETHAAPAAALVASVPVGGVLGATLRIARRHPVRFLAVNARLSLWPLVATPERAREMLFSASLPEADVARHQAHLQDEAYRAYVDMLVRRPRPDRVDTPMFVLGAADDQIFTTAEVNETAAAYGVEAVILDDLAHDVMLDTNWEQAADALRDGLDRLLS